MFGDKLIEIRKANKSDQSEYMRMRKLLWPKCSDERHQLETDIILSSSGIVIVAAVSKSKLIGFTEISVRSDHVEGTKESPVPYIEGWYVEKEFRKQGIGKSLIKYAEEFSLQLGYTELASDAELDNQNSIAIHKSIGFKEVGRTVHFVKKLAYDIGITEPGVSHCLGTRGGLFT